MADHGSTTFHEFDGVDEHHVDHGGTTDSSLNDTEKRSQFDIVCRDPLPLEKLLFGMIDDDDGAVEEADGHAEQVTLVHPQQPDYDTPTKRDLVEGMDPLCAPATAGQAVEAADEQPVQADAMQLEEDDDACVVEQVPHGMEVVDDALVRHQVGVEGNTRCATPLILPPEGDNPPFVVDSNLSEERDDEMSPSMQDGMSPCMQDGMSSESIFRNPLNPHAFIPNRSAARQQQGQTAGPKQPSPVRSTPPSKEGFSGAPVMLAVTVGDETNEAIILHSRLLTFLKRLTMDDQHPSRRGGLMEMHRLKRIAHAAKLSSVQRSKVIPPTAQGRKYVSVDLCGKHFLKQAEANISDADQIVSALESLSDDVVASEESVMSMIEDRLARIVSDNRARFADNSFRNMWDTLHLLTILTFYYISLDTNVLKLETDNSSDSQSWILVTLLCITGFWALDVLYSTQVMAIDRDGRLVKDQWSIIRQRKVQLVVDTIALVPIDFILEAAGAPFGTFLAFRVLKYVKLVRISYLYELVNRDIITPALVVFHFQMKKVVIGVAWLLFAILSFAAVHNLVDKYSILPAYGERKFPRFMDSVVAVSIVLSGSNANFEVWVAGDKVLYVILAILSMVAIGLIVGQLTSLVFSSSVSAENYQLMRDTLDVVEHYNVPKAIQREVLSFQMHALNGDVVRHMSNLAQLPLQMQKEILLYIKIDAIERVKLFSGATQECQAVLASSLTRCIVEPEVEVVRFGDEGNEMYMMAHGYADVILGNGKVVTTFTRGDCFGEMALVQQDAKRTATVRALTYCDLWTLTKDAFLEALAVYPELLAVVEKELVARNGSVEGLHSSVNAIHQEMHRMDEKEDEPLDSKELGDQHQNPDPTIVAVAAAARRRKMSCSVPDNLAEKILVQQQWSDDTEDLQGRLEQRDVHGGLGITSRRSLQGASTFRRVSEMSSGGSESAAAYNGAAKDLRRVASRLSVFSAAPKKTLHDEVQVALRVIESAKAYMAVDPAHSVRERRRTLFAL